MIETTRSMAHYHVYRSVPSNRSGEREDASFGQRCCAVAWARMRRTVEGHGVCFRVGPACTCPERPWRDMYDGCTS